MSFWNSVIRNLASAISNSYSTSVCRPTAMGHFWLKIYPFHIKENYILSISWNCKYLWKILKMARFQNFLPKQCEDPSKGKNKQVTHTIIQYARNYYLIIHTPVEGTSDCCTIPCLTKNWTKSLAQFAWASFLLVELPTPT